MNLTADKQKDENAETFGFVRVRVMRGTCYGSPALTIEMKFENNDKVLIEFTEGLQKKNVLLERPTAENFLYEIAGIIEKPEVLSGLRHVDVRYHAEIEWENITFINDANSGEFKAFSNEWFTESIEIFLEQEVENPEIAARFRWILDTNPHRHELEIYRLTRKFSRDYFPKIS